MTIVGIAGVLKGCAAREKTIPIRSDGHEPRRAIDVEARRCSPRPLANIQFAGESGQDQFLADFKGRVVVLNVWATWRRKEMPTLDRLQAALGSSDFQVVPLSIDRGGFDTIRKSYAEISVQKLGMYVDRSGRALRDLGAVGLPTTLIAMMQGSSRGSRPSEHGGMNDRTPIGTMSDRPDYQPACRTMSDKGYWVVAGLPAIVLGALCIAAGALLLLVYPESIVRESGAVVRSRTVAIGGPSSLVATDGQAVTDQTHRGKRLLIYFGNTSCPDACPTALNNMSVASEKLGPRADRLQPLFVTINPELDRRDAVVWMRKEMAEVDKRKEAKKMRHLANAVRVLLLALSLDGQAYAQANSIVVEQPWARATPGGAKTGAAYMTLKNNGMLADRLLSATTSVAEKVQFHKMTNEGGVSRMQEMPNVNLEPGAQVVFQPGGMHMMLVGLNQQLKEGQTLSITLRFEKAGSIAATVPIEKVGAMGPGHMGSMTDMPSHMMGK